MDISLIIPTFNRQSKLLGCLDSIFTQDYPQDALEVIVVDDGSTDGTRVMLEGLSRVNPNLRYFTQQNKGPAAARNLGLKYAQGAIIGFTDNDCILERDWVRKMVSAHQQEPHAVAIGGLTEVSRRNIKARVSQSLSDGAIQAKINGKAETIFFPTCNVTVKQQRLNGGFNELFPLPAGEDLDFFWRLFKQGQKLSYKQDIKVFHNCHADLGSFLKQAYMYGRGNYLVQYMHKDNPLLKEVKTNNRLSFIFGLVVNFLKIPRFSYAQGKRLISSDKQFTFYEKFQVYLYFTLHKTSYLIGNIIEHGRAHKIPALGPSPLKPEFIILDLTHRCNLKCKICEIRKDSPIEEFRLDEVKGLIDQALDWGVKEFVLSGGEPLIREDIFEILDYAQARKYHVGVLTNGVTLDENLIGRLLPYLTSNSLSLSISLDSLTPAIHDDIRGANGCFAKTSRGLKLLAGLKNNYPNINFNAISIILNKNLEELLALAEFLKSLNINSIQFQPLLSNNLIMKERAEGVEYWIPQQRLPLLDKAVDKLVEFKKQNPSLVRNSEENLKLIKKYFRGDLTSKDVRCLYATKTMLIANNGDLTTCFGRYGNARREKLKQIFASKESEQARERVKECQKPCLLPCFIS